jgi:hypothetical protein
MNHFAIFRSADVPPGISSDELAAYTQRTILRMQQSGNSLPPLLIMQVSESVAALVGVAKTGVIRHHLSGMQEMPFYYEIWLVGNAAFTDYVLALQGMIRDVETIRELSQPAMASGSSTQSVLPDSKSTAA